jgi:TRAP-type C4-dicarboxylate transport system permease small subunit
MNQKVVTIIAVVLIALGAIGLARGKFSYTEDTHEANVGNLHLSVKEKQSVALPQWLSIGAIAVGAVLLVFSRRK